MAAGRPTIIDLSFGEESATPRAQAIDRAELLASLAALVGPERALASAARVLDPADLATALPYLQPLALSASTRHQVSKRLLTELRNSIAEVTGEEVPALERLLRVRPRAFLTVAVLTGAFYLLLPQLANVDDSVRAMRSANWGWVAVCVVMSGLTYVASAIGMVGGVPGRLPFVPTVMAQLGSSFVNRVTPANVGGMALNVRFMQKAGVDSGAAVTGMGLNVVAGAIVHLVLLVAFFAWAGQSSQGSFAIPSSSKLLVAIAVVLAVVGIAAATTRGRRLFQTHVLRFLKQSWQSLTTLARSPSRLLELFGGSLAVTLAYTAALAAAVAALDADVSFAEVGAVYLGSSLIAAAAPTPGGLGAMEAALVAGFTGVGVEPGGRGCRRAHVPDGDVLATDPAGLALLPGAPAPQPHLRRRADRRGDPASTALIAKRSLAMSQVRRSSLSPSRARRTRLHPECSPTGATGRPSPPRPNAHRASVPHRRPRPAPPTTSSGRCTPA